MKKRIPYLFAICLSTVLLTSCEDGFLDEPLSSTYAPQTLSDSLGVEASLTGLYYDVSFWWTWSARQGWLSVWQAGTDIAYNALPEGIEIPYTDYSQLNSDDDAAERTWAWGYDIINGANTILATLQSQDAQNAMSQVGIQQAEAEARFFRGYIYNKLATFFGPIPLITEPVSGPKTDFTRASLDEVNAQIEEDLTFAAEHLPSIDDVKGDMYQRVNRAAARQELAVAYLRMGRPADALAQTQAIINSGDFQLIDERYGVKADQPGDYYHDMFTQGNVRRSQGNTEGIWVLEMENRNNVNGGYTDFSQLRRNWQTQLHAIPGTVITDSTGGRGLGRMRLNNWVLYDLYEAGDIRNSKYNIKRNYYYNDPSSPQYGQQIQPGAGGSVKQDTLYKIVPETTKWFNFDSNDLFGYATIHDIVVMRLGETYLLQAEAQVQMGDLPGAAETINKLRERAFENYPAEGQVTAADMDLDFILDERVRELVAEENRRETLMRTETLYDRVLDHIAPSEVASLPLEERIPYPIQSLTPDKAKYLPIPQSEIDLNQDGNLEQNPGY